MQQVAEITKMRTDHVRALEEGNYGAFTAPVYIRGFVRTYAGMLKLDVGAVLVVLDQELGQTEKFREPPSLTQEPPTALDKVMLRLSRVNWRVALPLLTVALIGVASFVGVRVWQNHRSRDPLEGVGPGLYEPASPLGGDTLPLPPAPAPRR